MDRFSGRFGEHGQDHHEVDAPNEGDGGFWAGSPEPDQRPALTRVQINALLSGDISAPHFGPELVDRLHRLCTAAGKRLHSVQVEVVHMPVTCPGCGQAGLCRCERKGVLQTRLYPLFGLYPWNCTCCRRTYLLRLRRPPVLPAISPERTAEAAGREAA